jgi:hypothetical protein
LAESSIVLAAIEPIELLVSSGVVEEAEDVGTEELVEPDVTGVPVCEPPVVTVAVEEHLTVIYVSSSMPQVVLTPSQKSGKYF